MLYIFDQDDNFLNIITEETGLVKTWFKDYQNHIPDETFVFHVDGKSELLKHIVEENQVAFYDRDNDLRLVRIKETYEVTTNDSSSIRVKCEPSFLELYDHFIEDRRVTNGTAETALNRVLEGSRYAGEVTVELGTATVNFYWISGIEGIFKILFTWGGSLKDTITLNDENEIIDRKIWIVQRLGTDNGLIVEPDYNAETISRNTLSYIETALWAQGASLETEGGGYSRYITFEDIEWSKSKGDPVDKPKGQKWIGDPDALEKYGLINIDTKGGRNLIRSRNYTESNQYQEVIKSTSDFNGQPIYKGIKLATGRPPVNMRSIAIKPGEIYTFSLYIKHDNENEDNNAYTMIYDTEKRLGLSRSYTEKVGEWERVINSYKNDTNEPKSVGMYFYLSGAVGDITYFSSPKLEKGTRATPWSPAPEDVPNGILHRYGHFSNQDYEDPEELLWATWHELQDRKLKEVIHEAMIYESDKKVSLGDTVTVLNRKYTKPIELQSQITGLEYDILYPNEEIKTVVGKYIDMNEDQLQKEVDELKEDVKRPRPTKPIDNDSFPDIKPSTPTNVIAKGAYETIQLSWDYNFEVYLSHYEVFGSQVADFVPDSQHLLWRGKMSMFPHEVDTDETWYYYVRAVNTRGTASDFSNRVSASSVRIPLSATDFEQEFENARTTAQQALDEANEAIGQAQASFDLAQQNATVIGDLALQIGSVDEGLTTITATVEGLQTTVTDLDGNVANLTLLVDTFQTTITNLEEDVSTQFTQLSNAINARVEKDDVVNQINISTEGILIDGKKVHITGQTIIDNGVIKNAYIESLSGEKIIAKTIGVDQLNVSTLSAITADLGEVTAGILRSQNNSTFFNLNTGELHMSSADVTLGGGADIEFEDAGNRLYYSRLDTQNSRTRSAGLGVGTNINDRFPFVYMGVSNASRPHATDGSSFSGFIANANDRVAVDDIGNSVVGDVFHIRDKAVSYSRGWRFEISSSLNRIYPLNAGSYDYDIGTSSSPFSSIHSTSYETSGSGITDGFKIGVGSTQHVVSRGPTNSNFYIYPQRYSDANIVTIRSHHQRGSYRNEFVIRYDRMLETSKGLNITEPSGASEGIILGEGNISHTITRNISNNSLYIYPQRYSGQNIITIRSHNARASYQNDFLINSSGNAVFLGSVTASSFSGNLSGNATSANTANSASSATTATNLSGGSVNATSLAMPYSRSEPGSANLTVKTNGQIYRATSARKYKRDIKPLSLADADNFFFNAKPIMHKDINPNNDNIYYGYIADDVATIDRRMVQFGENNEPEGFNYDRVSVLLHVRMLEESKRTTALEKRTLILEDWKDEKDLQIQYLQQKIKQHENRISHLEELVA